MGILYNKDRISNEVFSKEAGMETYIGHITDDGGRCQSLQDHLDGVAQLAEQFGQPFGCGAELLAQLMAGNWSRSLMREVAQYMISVRYMANALTSNWAKLLPNGQITLFENDIELAYLVNPAEYDEVKGLRIQEESGVGIMW